MNLSKHEQTIRTDYANLRSNLSKKIFCKIDIQSNKILTQLNTTHKANLYKTALKQQNYNIFQYGYEPKESQKLSYLKK